MESRRRVVAGLTVAAVVLIMAGVAAVAIDSGMTGPGPSTGSAGRSGTPLISHSPGVRSPSAIPPTPSGSLGPTPPGSSQSPSVAPTPSEHGTGFIVRAGSVVYLAADGTVVPVELVPGLRTAIVDGRAFYYAQPSNPYGLRFGAYAGEFLPNVTMQQADGSSAQTGGMALVGAVAARLIADRLAATSVATERWVVALPVDITGSVKTVEVTFDVFGLHGWSDTPRVEVHFSGQMRVTNVIPDNAGYHVLVEQLGVTTWQVIDPTRLQLAATKLDPEHMMNQILVYGTGTPSVGTDALIDRRVPIGRAMLTASDEVSVSLVVRGSRADLGPDRILKVGDVPVFAASS